MIIDKRLISEIDQKKERLSRNPDYQDSVRHRYFTCLAQEANNNSSLLEITQSNTGKYNCKNKRLELEGKIKENQERLGKALAYGTINYSEPYNVDFMVHLASFTEPSINGLRTENVRITGAKHMLPPRYEKIPKQLFSLLEEVYQGKNHPVENAALLHFHIARIHPFIDGNGRTARLMQNLHLQHYGYPPVIIENRERHHYIDLIDEAVSGYYGKDIESMSNAERIFYNYIGSKVNASFDKIQERMDDTKAAYTLEISAKNVRYAAYSLKEQLKSYFRKRDIIGSVRLSNEGRSLEVVAGVPEKLIRTIADANEYIRSYKISSK